MPPLPLRHWHGALTGSMRRLLFRVRNSEREHAAVSDDSEHQPQCPESASYDILSHEFTGHALTGTGSMRPLLFRVRVRERAYAAGICLP